MGNINPLMVMVLVTDILIELQKQFRSLALRIDFVKENLHNDMISVLQQIHRPKEIELMLKQEDIRGKSVLQYIADLKLYKFLQINHVNRIIN